MNSSITPKFNASLSDSRTRQSWLPVGSGRGPRRGSPCRITSTSRSSKSCNPPFKAGSADHTSG